MSSSYFFDSSSSEDIDAEHYHNELNMLELYHNEVEESSHKRGGSTVGRRYLEREHFAGNERLMNDYFVENPTYSAEMFRRRFRMRRPLFNRILAAIRNHDRYFTFRPNASKTQGFSGHQKMTAAMRMLAYGCPADSIDETLRISESTVLESLDRFCQAICNIYGDEYVRRPNEADVQRLLQMHGSRGWPGMLGSIDCMHWEWKNCPKALQGTYTGKDQTPTIILEAVASYDLWIWHAFFGMPGSNNDINVVERSTLFNDLANGRSTPVSFTVGGNTYDHGYYLGDGIYPKWSTIVKTIPNPMTNKQRKFAAMQEGQRKDVERAFGVLQARFAIISNPCRLWSPNKMTKIMYTCVILHNMILEDERDMDEDFNYENAPTMPDIYRQDMILTDSDFNFHINQQMSYRNANLHHKLQNDLINHIWNFCGDQ